VQTNHAWLAGILDGEGCFTLFQKSCRSGSGEKIRSITANITITNSSAAIIDECVRLLTSANVKFALFCPRNSHTRPLRRISVRNYAAILSLLDTVEPFLVGKLPQAQLMRKFVEGAQRRGSLLPEDRERFYLEMRNMNRLGSLIL
jgi:hypothetical protein